MWRLTKHGPKSNRACRVLLAIKEIGLHRSFALDVNQSARLELKRVAKGFARRGRNVDATGQTIGFHSLGGIYGIAPDIVCDFVGAQQRWRAPETTLRGSHW